MHERVDLNCQLPENSVENAPDEPALSLCHIPEIRKFGRHQKENNGDTQPGKEKSRPQSSRLVDTR